MQKSEIQFDSEFEVEGVWWIPENPDIKIKGSLSYYFKNGIKLKTTDNFKFVETQKNSLNG